MSICTAAEAIRPVAAALMPSSEARTTRYCLSWFQKRYTKNIRNVPGRKMPAVATKLPSNCPAMPYSRMASVPINAVNANTGPGTTCATA